MDVALLGAAAADAEELGSAARFFLRVYKPVAFSPSPLSAVALSGVSLASCGAVAFALAVAVRQAGLAGPHPTAYCSARVSGWWIVQMFLVFLDFVLMLRSIRDPARPRPWDRDASVGAIQKAFARGWSNLIIGSTLSLLPPLLWVRHGGLRTFGPACILVVLYGVFNSSLTAVEWVSARGRRAGRSGGLTQNTKKGLQGRDRGRGAGGPRGGARHGRPGPEGRRRPRAVRVGQRDPEKGGARVRAAHVHGFPGLHPRHVDSAVRLRGANASLRPRRDGRRTD